MIDGTISRLDSGIPRIYGMVALPSGDLIVAGMFDIADEAMVRNVARWDGSSWSAFGSIPGRVNALLRASDGTLYAGGDFDTADAAPANSVVRWNGAGWQQVGVGLRDVWALHEMPNGDIIAGGAFSFNGDFTISMRNIARWRNGAWEPIGTGLADRVTAISHLPDGRIVAEVGWYRDSGPTHGLYVWDGSSWSLAPDIRGSVSKISIASNGDLLIAGRFHLDGGPQPPFGSPGVPGMAARWNGAKWTKLSGGLYLDSSPAILFEDPSQKLFLGGNYLKRFSGGGPSIAVLAYEGGNWELTSEGRISRTDLNADGRVDDVDFPCFAFQYDIVRCGDAQMPTACSADFTLDGTVDDADFLIFVQDYNLVTP